MNLVDYHTHPYSHGEIDLCTVYSKEYLSKFIRKAEEREIKYLGFSDHDYLLIDLNINKLKQIINTIPFNISIGLEFDFYPGKEEEIRQVIEQYSLDYAIGSVHHIKEWAFDHPDYIDQYKDKDIDHLYTEYFQLVQKAASSGLFDIIGHIDLIKVFGYRPSKIDILVLIEPVLSEIKKQGMAIEINTNGLNKPVAEIYPSLPILKKAIEYDIPITFGSDAHSPEQTGAGIKEAACLADNLGLKKVAVFKERTMKLIDL